MLLTNNLEKAFKESFGYDMDEFNRRFNRYLRKKYFPVLLEKKSPGRLRRRRSASKPGRLTFSPCALAVRRAGRRVLCTQDARDGSGSSCRPRTARSGQERDQGLDQRLPADLL